MTEKISLLYIGSDRKIINRLKAYPGISLAQRRSYSEAASAFRSWQKTDVILCERFIKGGDVFKVFQLYKKYNFFNRVPFILYAVEYEDDLLKNALDLGIDDLYFLPFPSIGDLLSRIEFLSAYKRRNLIKKVISHKTERYKMPLSKRLFDIVVATTALILLSPVLLLVMIAIRLESKGKVYYTSKRVGQKTFNFYKFRSMRTGAEDELKILAKFRNQYISKKPDIKVNFQNHCPCSKKVNFARCSPLLYTESYSICETWYTEQKNLSEKTKPNFIKIPNDPRVTRVGKIIRNTSLDELPQLINVIKGDMSIVGNRPLPIYEAEKLTHDPMAKRFLAPAGLTGLWQVEKRGRKGAMSDEERKQLDNQYAELFLQHKYSFMYDIKLIMKTIPVIIQKDSV